MGQIFSFLRSRKGKRLLIWGSIALVVFTIASVELTSQSWFCNSCHIMNPYYATWKASTHKDVACVECHISPGVDNFVAAKLNGLGQVVDDVLHRTSPKPSASVSQFACTRPGCHVPEDVARSDTTPTSSVPYKFRHIKHLGLEYKGITLECASCHSHVKGDNHFDVNTEMCITCHMVEGDKDARVDAVPGAPAGIAMRVRAGGEGGRASDAPVTPAPGATPAAHKSAPASCTTCHDAPAGTLDRHGLKVDHAQFLSYNAACESCHRGATAPPESIHDASCLACHTFGVERALPAQEMHTIHAGGKHKIECFSCHGTVAHGLSAQSGRLEGFDCRTCHSDQHAIQRSTYFKSTAAPHGTSASGAVSPMFLAHVDCTGCHIRDRAVSTNPSSGSRVAAASPQACDACHAAGLGTRMIPLWQKGTRAMYEQAEASLRAAEQSGNADAPTLTEARAILELVRVDGSWGVHNPKYTQQLLEEAARRLAHAVPSPSPAPKEPGK